MPTGRERWIRILVALAAGLALIAVGAIGGVWYERSRTADVAPPTTPPSGSTPVTPSATPPTAATPVPSPSASTATSGPPTDQNWKLAFSQEFNGRAYDPAKLSPCFDWNYGSCTKTFNNGREAYRADQVRVGDGVATLTAQPASQTSSGCGNRTCSYDSGLLSTSRPQAEGGGDYLYAFRYGYVEARMQIPDVQGFFTAFWMLPADPSFKYGSEIDILENLGGKPETVFQTYHYDNRSQEKRLNTGFGNNGSCPVTDYSQGMHRYGVNWQPTGITFYIDGVACGSFTDTSQITSEPMQIIMNLMVDNDWQREAGLGLRDPQAKASLKVDYLRVYRLQ